MLAGVSAAADTTVDPGLYSGMRWRSVGPARGGRSIAVGGSDARPNEYWFGATGGGAWKTTDGGTNWAPMTDGKITTSSVGALGVCQSNPDVVYIGGGETDSSAATSSRATASTRPPTAARRGRTSACSDSQAIARLRVHPTNCDIVLRGGARARSTTTSHERGVFKTTDGGKTWRRTLFRDDKTGARRPRRSIRRTRT